MTRFITISIALFIFFVQCVAQPQTGDTCLYIIFDKGSNFEKSHKARARFFRNRNYLKFETVDSGFHQELNKKILPPDSYIIKPNSDKDVRFEGRTKDGYNRVPSKTISLRELRKYPVVTWEEVLTFVKTNYRERRVEEYAPDEVNTVPPPADPLGSINFWGNIRHVYMVEKDEKKKIAILTEVTIRADEM